MRDYGTIDSPVWKHPAFRPLSDRAKLLFCYLRTCPHGNILGAFHLPMLYIAADLRWSEEEVRVTVTELLPNRFAVYCEATEYVLLPKHLEKLPFQNQNQAKSALKLFSEIPRAFIGLDAVAEILRNSWDWNNDITDDKQEWKPLIDRLSNGSGTVPEPVPYSVTVTGTVTGTRKDMSGGAPDVRQLNGKSLKDEARTILAFLNEKAGRNYQPGDVNLKLIVARLKEPGVTPVMLRQVVAKKCREWKGDPRMEMYLRPATLFNATKCAQYLGELVASDE